MTPLRILLIDDHPLFRRGLRGSLEAQRDLIVAGEAVDGEEGIRLCDVLVPDVTLVDLNLPDMSGLNVVRLLKRHHPRIGILVLTMHEDDEQLFSAIRAGANAYATKDIDSISLVEMLRRVGRGEFLINESLLRRPELAARVLDQFRELSEVDATPGSVYSPLTPREFEILKAIARGHSNKEIAQLHRISDQTVKNHVTSILRKLAVNDRTQAVIHALRHGWITVEMDPSGDQEAGSWNIHD